MHYNWCVGIGALWFIGGFLFIVCSLSISAAAIDDGNRGFGGKLGFVCLVFSIIWLLSFGFILK